LEERKMKYFRFIKNYNLWTTFGKTHALILGNLVFEIPIEFQKVKEVWKDMYKPEEERIWIKWTFFKILFKLIHLKN
jgi:UDP-galactopyranose mutase